MRIRGETLLRTITALFLLALVLAISASAAAQVSPPSSWTGVLRDEVRNPVVKATIQLHSATTDREYNAQTSANGTFAFHDVPAGTYELMALIKDTTFGHRGNAELGALEFRAEFFNILKMVNFGLPSNLIRGSGFGIISETATPRAKFSFR